MLAQYAVRPIDFQPVRPDPAAILGALSQPVLALDRDRRVRFLNQDAQRFLKAGAAALLDADLAEVLPADSPVFNLLAKAFADGSSMSEYGVVIDTPRIGRHVVTVRVDLLGEAADIAVLSLQEVSIARRIDNQLTHRNAARSVSAMAAMLAHEVKNPLSGIRGAAQLLEQNVGAEDHELTRLICDEADRIVSLVNRMEVFSDGQPIERDAVNIHMVLERVRRLAENGFARHVRFSELYDPSLPAVLGHWDQLVQVFLNLVKNAAEAVPAEGGEIVLSTAYQRGVSIAVPGSGDRVHLPLVVSVQDNGGGIPDDLRDHLFDPFVTTKANGTGLGLALVAKMVGDHGGVIECDSRPKRTVFRVFLPMAGSRAWAADPSGAEIARGQPAGPEPVRPEPAGRERA